MSAGAFGTRDGGGGARRVDAQEGARPSLTGEQKKTKDLKTQQFQNMRIENTTIHKVRHDKHNNTKG